MKEWSKAWISSTNPGKQRKYRAQAPLHVQGQFLRAHVAKALRQKVKSRSVRVRKGDTVKIMRGSFAGKTGKVESVNMKKQKVYITGIDRTKKDGGKALYPINASNLLVQDVDTTDKRRFS